MTQKKARPFNRPKADLQQLKAVLRHHLWNDENSELVQQSIKGDAIVLLDLATHGDPANPSVTNIEEQYRNLELMKYHANLLAESFESLHWSVQIELADAARKSDQSGHDARARLRVSHVLALRTLIDLVYDDGKSAVKLLARSGKTNESGIAVLEHLRELWRLRTGSEAPVELATKSRFGRFATDTLRATGCGTYVGVFRAWRARRQALSENSSDER